MYQQEITFSPDEVLVYLRKSRSDDPLLSVEEVLEKHEKRLDEWAEKHLGGVVPECNKFREIVSGETIKSRPVFQNVLRVIESTKYKAVLIYDCTRLGRPDTETIGRITNLFRYTSTFILTLDFVFDLTDDFGRERLKMELERGNWYLEAYKKMNKHGRESSVKDGWFIGSIAPYGYDKIKVLDGKRERPTLAINETEAEAVRIAFDLYVNHDMGYISVAHRLNELGLKPRKSALWTQPAIKDLLTNEHLIGKVRWNWRKTVSTVKDGEIEHKRPKSKDYYVFDGRHPAIIDTDLFERARAKRGKNTRIKKGCDLRNILAGLIFCHCGKAMIYRTYKKNGKERSSPRLLCNNQVYCHTQSVTYDEVLNKVIDALNACIADFEVYVKNDSKDAVKSHTDLIKRLELKLEELRKKELSLWEKYTDEKMPKQVFDKLNEKVLQEIETATQGLAKARASAPIVIDYHEKIMRFTDAVQAVKNPNVSAELKNRLLKACIERIEYRREGENPFELDIILKI